MGTVLPKLAQERLTLDFSFLSPHFLAWPWPKRNFDEMPSRWG